MSFQKFSFAFAAFVMSLMEFLLVLPDKKLGTRWCAGKCIGLALYWTSNGVVYLLANAGLYLLFAAWAQIFLMVMGSPTL